jgi:hypothetical protein
MAKKVGECIRYTYISMVTTRRGPENNLLSLCVKNWRYNCQVGQVSSTADLGQYISLGTI